MAERVTTAGRIVQCDICGKPILPGERCRIVRDDFMDGLVFFEHKVCPTTTLTPPPPIDNITKTKRKD